MDEVSSHVCLVLPSTDGKAARKIVPPRLRIPYWKGLGADSEEKHEPVKRFQTIHHNSVDVARGCPSPAAGNGIFGCGDRPPKISTKMGERSQRQNYGK